MPKKNMVISWNFYGKITGLRHFEKKRHKKWYTIIMKVSLKKTGIINDKIVEVINFRVNPNETDKLIDKKMYFPAYHMNKHSWISLYLENLKDINELEENIDKSYIMAVK